jgi:hypothetical protein
MANEQTRPPGLTPQDFHSARAEITSEGVKGLFLLNGGGAVALLAFLQAIWDNKPLAKVVVIGIGILTFGALIAGFVNFFRYHTSFNFQAGKTNAYKVFRNLALTFQYLSLVAFAAGAGVIVVGAWSLLS